MVNLIEEIIIKKVGTFMRENKKEETFQIYIFKFHITKRIGYLCISCVSLTLQNGLFHLALNG